MLPDEALDAAARREAIFERIQRLTQKMNRALAELYGMESDERVGPPGPDANRPTSIFKNAEERERKAGAGD